MRNIILASGSPRRRELLGDLGLEFVIEKSGCEESYTAAEPEEIVRELALIKARDVFAKHPDEDVLVIGADTIVALNGKVLGKPADAEDAHAMLAALSGRTHQVYTGTALLWQGHEEVFAVCTDVSFYPLTEEEIAAYIKSGDPFDKAGAYGIQSGAMRFVERISGDYNNVVGLPASRLYQELKKYRLIQEARDV